MHIMRHLVAITIAAMFVSSCAITHSLSELRTTSTHTLHVGEQITLQHNASIDSLSRNTGEIPFIVPTSSFHDPSMAPDFNAGEQFVVKRIDARSGFDGGDTVITLYALNHSQYVYADYYHYDMLFECPGCD